MANVRGSLPHGLSRMAPRRSVTGQCVGQVYVTAAKCPGQLLDKEERFTSLAVVDDQGAHDVPRQKEQPMNLAPVTLRGCPSGPLPTRSTVSPCCCPGTTSLLRSQSGSQPQQEMRAGTIPEGRFGSASWLELDPLVLLIMPWTRRVNCTRWPASRWGNSGAGRAPLSFEVEAADSLPSFPGAVLREPLPPRLPFQF